MISTDRQSFGDLSYPTPQLVKMLRMERHVGDKEIARMMEAELTRRGMVNDVGAGLSARPVNDVGAGLGARPVNDVGAGLSARPADGHGK